MGQPSTEVKALAVAKLRSSGLEPQHISATVVPPADMGALGFPPYPALKLVYLDPLSKKPMSSRPHWPEFVRYRFLVDLPTTGKQKRPLRYVQPPDSGVCAFFPHTVNWQEVFDENRKIYITEGELKAAKACERGFPTIGLGGVSSYQNNAGATGFLPELERINWVQRRVCIIYDSDVREKPGVSAALNALAHELELRGAVPFTAVLPSLPSGDKCGLDDYFVAHPDPEEFRAFLAHAEQSLTLAQPLWEMNKHAVYIHDPSMIVVTDTNQFLNPQAFLVSYGNRVVSERKVKDDGSISLKPVPVAPVWLKWPLRRDACKVTYAPGQPSTHDAFNTWQGWGTTPVKGDVRLFTRLIDHLFYTTTREHRDWFLRWLAYPIQHPGTKLFTAAVLHGAKQGTGKSFIGYCVGRIYGKNFVEIKKKDLHGDFNSWARDKQFVMGDDVTGSDRREQADALKAMITQKEIRINIKYVPDFVVPDCVNYLFTSNQPDAFFLEDGDRRFFIHEVLVDPLPLQFYHDLEDWLASEDGGNALHHYLLNLPMGDFDPRNPAPMTPSKAAMIHIGKSDLAEWVDTLVHSPDTILRLGNVPIDGDLFSSRDLLMLYDLHHVRGVTCNAMARALKRASVPVVYNGQPIPYLGLQDRFFALRQPDKWAKASRTELIKHLERTKKGTTPR